MIIISLFFSFFMSSSVASCMISSICKYCIPLLLVYFNILNGKILLIIRYVRQKVVSVLFSRFYILSLPVKH